MKVLSGLVTQGSGSIGGLTMSNNKSGYYLRSRTVPSNPQTSLQTSIRSSMAALSSNWQALSSADQNSWNLYASNVTIVTVNGQQKKLTGFNWYIACNQLRAQCGSPYITTAPSTFTLASAPAIGAVGYLSATSTVFTATVIDPPLSAGTGDELMVFIGRPQTGGRLYFKGPWQFVGCYDTFLAPSGIVEDLSGLTPYVAAGSQNQWIRVVRTLPDGRYSTPVIKGPFGAFVDGTDAYAFTVIPWNASKAHGTPSSILNPVSAGVISYQRMYEPVTSLSAVQNSAALDVAYDGTHAAGSLPFAVEGFGSLGAFTFSCNLTLT